MYKILSHHINIATRYSIIQVLADRYFKTRLVVQRCGRFSSVCFMLSNLMILISQSFRLDLLMLGLGRVEVTTSNAYPFSAIHEHLLRVLFQGVLLFSSKFRQHGLAKTNSQTNKTNKQTNWQTTQTESSIAAFDGTSFCYCAHYLRITDFPTMFPSFKTHRSTVTPSFTLGSKFPAM